MRFLSSSSCFNSKSLPCSYCGLKEDLTLHVLDGYAAEYQRIRTGPNRSEDLLVGSPDASFEGITAFLYKI